MGKRRYAQTCTCHMRLVAMWHRQSVECALHWQQCRLDKLLGLTGSPHHHNSNKKDAHTQQRPILSKPDLCVQFASDKLLDLAGSLDLGRLNRWQAGQGGSQMVAHKVGVAIGTCSALLCWYIVRTCTSIESVNTASFTGKMTEWV